MDSEFEKDKQQLTEQIREELLTKARMAFAEAVMSVTSDPRFVAACALNIDIGELVKQAALEQVEELTKEG